MDKVRTLVSRALDDDMRYYEFAGPSGLPKPTGGDIACGSTFIEIDTGLFYLYHESDEQWIPQLSINMFYQGPGPGSGSGGNSGGVSTK